MFSFARRVLLWLTAAAVKAQDARQRTIFNVWCGDPKRSMLRKLHVASALHAVE